MTSYVFVYSTLHTLALTFSYEAGEAREKQIRKTSVCGYERGLNLS